MVSRKIYDWRDGQATSGTDLVEPQDSISFYFVEGRRATHALVKFLRNRELFRSELMAFTCNVDPKAAALMPFRTYSPGPYLAHNVICWNWDWEITRTMFS